MVQTDEERKARQKVSRKKYEASAKGKISSKKYQASAKGQESNKKYNSSNHGKTTRGKYASSSEGKTTRGKYASSSEGKASMKKYQASAKGQEYAKKYSQDSEHKTRAKNTRDDARLKILEAYSKRISNSNVPCCNCCGEKSYLEFLALDHITGRKQMDSEPNLTKLGYSSKLKGLPLNVWIIKNDYPDGFQILCHNCNNAKGFYGKCPHEMK